MTSNQRLPAEHYRQPEPRTLRLSVSLSGDPEEQSRPRPYAIMLERWIWPGKASPRRIPDVMLTARGHVSAGGAPVSREEIAALLRQVAASLDEPA